VLQATNLVTQLVIVKMFHAHNSDYTVGVYVYMNFKSILAAVFRPGSVLDC